MQISIIIRTLNEEKYLKDLLSSIRSQLLNENIFNKEVEVVLVDSGSNDSTIDIARNYKCMIRNIKREHFSFGRSLNYGCEASTGDIFVFVSGHCVPVGNYWLDNLCSPLIGGNIQYIYGKQIGGPETKLSESRIFEKYFKNESAIPQVGFFCNNANSAILASTWFKYRFNEDLTGLEDMYMASELSKQSVSVGYISSAVVVHHHDENWSQIRNRFEREAIALRVIMPQIYLTGVDVCRYFFISIASDMIWALKNGIFINNIFEIFLYRYNQFIGSYIGNKMHRDLSKSEKEKYFYPK